MFYNTLIYLLPMLRTELKQWELAEIITLALNLGERNLL